MDFLDDTTGKRVVGARSIIIHPYEPRKDIMRSPEDRLEEAKGLAEAIWLQVGATFAVPLRQINAHTYIGKGKVEEMKPIIKENRIELVVMDTELSPGAQRALEGEWECKVIDRTGLILEIFSARAQTAEGSLQVELAMLEYQKSRLVRTWTHLERQRGGFGVMGGMGETQLEVDRRMIRDRIALIKGDLEKVKRTRALHRKSRSSVPYPIVALVGYTNAGKSTLFNKLTGADVLVKDMLFATLDPTMRLITLPSKQKVIMSDTVGFISNLPTQLVAAFRATLEEVIEADLILHVRDISAEDTNAQKFDVIKVLNELGLEEKIETSLVEVLNKIDKVEGDPRSEAEFIKVSALTGEGCEELLNLIDNRIKQKGTRLTIELPIADGKTLAWLYQHGKDVETETLENTIKVEVTLSNQDAARFEQKSDKKEAWE